MKTQKTGGRYDYTRRAFRNMDEMAYYLGRSASYVQGRLTGGGDFTDRETDELNKAVKFYDRTDIYPVTFQKMQRRNKDESIKFVYSIAWTMITAGSNMVEAIKAGRQIADGLFADVPNYESLIDTLYELTDF